MPNTLAVPALDLQLATSNNSTLRPKTISPRTIRFGLRFFVISVELAIVSASFILSYWLLILHDPNRWSAELLWAAIPAVVLIRGSALMIFGVFWRSFRHAGIRDLVAIAKAVGLSSVCLYFVRDLWVPSNQLPGALFVRDALICFLALAAFHFSARLYALRRNRKSFTGKRAVIVGAGDGGACLVNDLSADPQSKVRAVAFVDDDLTKKGSRICDVPVVGDLSELQKAVSEHNADEILICIPSATREQTERILNACRQCGVPVRMLPSLAELTNGMVTSKSLRPIRMDDILQRECLVCDPEMTRALVAEKVVLVTGAGGSIGSELCRQLADASPRRLVLVDKSENNLFHIQLAVRERAPNLDVAVYLRDITDAESVREMFASEAPQVVFHAAAFKHVGMMELHPQEAIRNNVLGTRNVAHAALAARVESFVNISTDKAVSPQNYMGLSKMMAEMIIRDLAKEYGVRFMNVRFGNVAGSAGSVIQLFSDQILKGGPLRVTDPQATRYFMSIPEAAFLILCAGQRGRGGETFVFDMGQPINIYQLARTLSLYSGLAPGEELPIEFIGLRDGEKFHEDLWDAWEVPRKTDQPRLLCLDGTNPLAVDIQKAVAQFEKLLSCRDYKGLLDFVDRVFPSFARQRSPRHEVREYRTDVQLSKVG
ncbi:MAG: SDR family NAD(P)-dependent oxidoreductase [Candidatus Acidiferrales bacterium]